MSTDTIQFPPAVQPEQEPKPELQVETPQDSVPVNTSHGHSRTRWYRDLQNRRSAFAKRTDGLKVQQSWLDDFQTYVDYLTTLGFDPDTDMTTVVWVDKSKDFAEGNVKVVPYERRKRSQRKTARPSTPVQASVKPPVQRQGERRYDLTAEELSAVLFGKRPPTSVTAELLTGGSGSVYAWTFNWT